MEDPLPVFTLSAPKYALQDARRDSREYSPAIPEYHGAPGLCPQWARGRGGQQQGTQTPQEKREQEIKRILERNARAEEIAAYQRMLVAEEQRRAAPRPPPPVSAPPTLPMPMMSLPTIEGPNGPTPIAVPTSLAPLPPPPQPRWVGGIRPSALAARGPVQQQAKQGQGQGQQIPVQQQANRCRRNNKPRCDPLLRHRR